MKAPHAFYGAAVPASLTYVVHAGAPVDVVVEVARESDGVHVRLLWHPAANAVTVSVEDARAGAGFQLAVAPDRALDAFYHPFAYSA